MRDAVEPEEMDDVRSLVNGSGRFFSYGVDMFENNKNNIGKARESVHTDNTGKGNSETWEV